MKARTSLLTCWLLTLLTSITAQAAYPSVYYESIAGSELVAASLANPVHGIGTRAGNVTNIAVAGDRVYFQDGVNIYAANPDLSGISLFHTNGVSITDLAVDAVNGIYYESIAGSELVAASLANPVHGIGVRAGNVTNIALAGGKVYFQDGVNIYVANPDLTGITLFHTNGVAITDLAVYVAAVPEPAQGAMLLLGVGLVIGWTRRKRS